jgi:hypothetical protein
VVRDDASRPTAAIVVEVQRWFDSRKRWTWPAYLASLRAIHRCPVFLLVVAPVPAVAQWARRPIDLGHPGLSLRPIVVGYAQIPSITDFAVAQAAPELAVLSALAHPRAAVAAAAIAAIGRVESRSPPPSTATISTR